MTVLFFEKLSTTNIYCVGEKPNGNHKLLYKYKTNKMDREDLIKRVEAIQDVKKDYRELYSIMEELGISYKKTTCRKCLNDYMNIVKEELGLIDDAAENSDFNSVWVYLRDRTLLWTREDGTKVKINRNTPVDIIEEFVINHKGFFKKTNN